MAVYVKDKDGGRVKVAGLGARGPAGKSAYQYAAEGGFSGSEDQFAALLGSRSNPNLLDNWYFADPINQRGQTEYTGRGYTIDRWLHETTTAGVLVGPNGISFSGQFDPDAFYFSQVIDVPKESLYGKTLTGSIMVDGKLYYGSVHVKDLWDDWESVLLASSDKFGFYFQKTNEGMGGYFRVLLMYTHAAIAGHAVFQAVKLELGPAQTLARQDAEGNWALNDPPPNKALELLKCQRYMVVLPNTGSRYAYIGCGASNSTTQASITIPVPSRMRALPTVTATGTWSLSGYGKTITVPKSGTFTGTFYSANGVDILVSNVSGLTAHQFYALQVNSDETAQLILDANL